MGFYFENALSEYRSALTSYHQQCDVTLLRFGQLYPDVLLRTGLPPAKAITHLKKISSGALVLLVWSAPVTTPEGLAAVARVEVSAWAEGLSWNVRDPSRGPPFEKYWQAVGTQNIPEEFVLRANKLAQNDSLRNLWEVVLQMY